jgi:hypothetical protein
MRRHGGKRLRIAALGALVVVLLGVAAGAWIVRQRLSPEAAAAQLSQALGREVRVGDVGLRFRPGPRLRMERIATPDLEVRAVELAPRIAPLLRGELEVAALRVEGTRLSLVRSPDGSVTFGAAARTVAIPAGGEAADLPALPRIELHDSTLNVVDRTAGPEPVTVQAQVDVLRIRDFATGRSARFALSGSAGEGERRGTFAVSGALGPLSPAKALAAQPLRCAIETRRLDPALVARFLPDAWGVSAASGAMSARVSLRRNAAGDLEGELDLAFEPGVVVVSAIAFGGRSRVRATMSREGDDLRFSDGFLEADSVTVGDAVARDVRGRFEYADRRLVLPSLAYGAYDGALRQTGAITFDETPHYDVTVEAERLDLGAFTGLREGDAAEPGGPRLTGRLELRGRWTGEPNWLSPSGFQPVEGGGRIEIRGGTLPAADLVRAIARAVPNLLTAVANGEGGAPPRRTPLRSLTATAVVGEGWIRTEDLRLTTDAYTVTGRGRLGADLGLDLTTRVEFTSGAQGLAVPPIPVRVTGTLTEPQFLPDMSGVPVAALRALPWYATGVPLGAARQAGEVLGQGAGRLRDTIRGKNADPEQP